MTGSLVVAGGPPSGSIVTATPSTASRSSPADWTGEAHTPSPPDGLTFMLMEPRSPRFAPFLVAAGILLILCIAAIRLPDSYASLLERDRALDSAQAGWAYRLLVFAAIGQAVYGGFAIFTVEKVQKVRSKDERTAAMSNDEIVRSLARIAAGMVVLTLVYGVASFFVTGQRGGFWLFAVLAVAQGAWYFRQVGQIAEWLDLQRRTDPSAGRRPLPWSREPPDYSPPLGR